MTSAKHLSQSGPDKDREEMYLCHRLCVKIQTSVGGGGSSRVLPAYS